MNDSEQQIRDLFDAPLSPDPRRSAELRKEVVHMFDQKLKKAKWIAWIFIVIAGVVLFAGMGMVVIGLARSMKALVIGVMLILGAGQMEMLAKLWYWQMNTKLNLQKELKQLRLQLAELTGGRQAEAE